uniref:Uncharacterized protein n=1 Tax=Rhabditophanes sp. KR3021 TaxID=114890 RepID=A0AC35UCV5_9BILA
MSNPNEQEIEDEIKRLEDTARNLQDEIARRQELSEMIQNSSSFQEGSYGLLTASSVSSSNHDATNNIFISVSDNNGLNTGTGFAFDTNCHLSTISTNTRSLSPNNNDWRSKEAERLANWTKMDNIKNEHNKLKGSLSNTLLKHPQIINRKMSKSPNTMDEKEFDGSFNETTRKLPLIRSGKWSTAYRHDQNKK